MAILQRSKKSILGLDVQLGNIETNISNNAINISNEITNRISSAASIQSQVTTNKSKVDILNADTLTVGSVDYKINQITNSLAVATNVYTKAESDTLLDAKINNTLTLSTVTIENKLVTQTELATKANTSTIYTKSETDTLLNGKAEASKTYTKTEVDTALTNKADLSTTYTKTTVDTLLSPKANSADVYTKSEVDTQFGTVLVDADTISPVTTLNKIATYTELSTKANSNDVYTKTEINSTMSNVLVDSDVVTAVSTGNKVVTEYELSTKANTTDTYTKTQVDTALTTKANSTVAGKVGPSLIVVDETNKADGKVLSFNNISGNLEYVVQTGGAILNDTVTNATNGWSSTKIYSELSKKVDASTVYTKSETDGLISTAGQGIKYSVVDAAALNALNGMVVDEQAIVEANRYVYKYNGTTWIQFYAMDASHNHDDKYYTETETNTLLSTKANTVDTYTKTQVDTALTTKANSTVAGKVGPSLIVVDETNKADGKILSFSNTSGNLEYVSYDSTNIIDDTTSVSNKVYSSNKTDSLLSLKANAADLYTKSTIDTKMSAVLVDGDSISTVTDSNKLATATELNLKANVNDVYTQSQVNTFLAAKVNTSDVKTAITATNKVVTEAEIIGKVDTSSVYTKSEIDTSLSNKANNGDAYTKSETNNLLNTKLNSNLTVTAVTTTNKIITQTEVAGLATIANIYTKTEVNNLLAPKFSQDNAVSTVNDGNKLVTQTELATKVNLADVKSAITTGNKMVTESDITSAINVYKSTVGVFPSLVVDRKTLSVKSSVNLDYVFQFGLSSTPYGNKCVGDEIVIYNFYENGDASVFETVKIFDDKHAEISVTLSDTSEESKYTGKTVKITYLTTELIIVPGTDINHPIIINVGVDFEAQGGGTTSYALDFAAASYYKIIFADGYYTTIVHDTNHTNFHATNSTDYQAVHYSPNNEIQSYGWVGITDEVQYIIYNWTMAFANVSGTNYTLSFTRNAAVGGGFL